MAMLMEGELSFSWRGDLVAVEDEVGQRVCFTRGQFFPALARANQLERDMANVCENVVPMAAGAKH